MIEILEKIGLAVIGGLIVWLGTLLADRRKRKDSQRESLRRAYSQWFASETILAQRVKALVVWVRETPLNKEQHDAILREVKSVEDEVKPLVTSLNEVLLLETDQTCRDAIVQLSQGIEKTFEVMQKMSMHHRTHLSEKNEREDIRRTLEAETNPEIRPLLQKQIDMITEWDEKCKFITPESVEEIGKISTDFHQLVCDFRNTLTKRSLV